MNKTKKNVNEKNEYGEIYIIKCERRN